MSKWLNCDLWLCWSLSPITLLIYVTCDYCWSLSASLLGAMTGRVKCGTQPRGRSYTPWKGTAMWCTPLHSTIHMGKTFKHLRQLLLQKYTRFHFYLWNIREMNPYHIRGLSERLQCWCYKWRCWKCYIWKHVFAMILSVMETQES